MKSGERGFLLIELLVSLGIIALVSLSAGAAIFPVFRSIGSNNDYLTTVRDTQNAGYFISRDTQRAQTVNTDNLTPPDFIIFNWTVWDADGNPIYHSARYFFENLTNDIGKLKRNHWSSAGADEEMLIAAYIYYDPGDIEHTTQATYQDPILTLRLTSLIESTMETREYKIKHRPVIR